MAKRILSAFLAIILSFSIIPAFSGQAQAAKVGYDYQQALAYAKKHWNDGKGLCAEFVSDCLKAGGITDVYEPMVINLYNQLLKKNHGTSYNLKLTSGKKGYIMKADNQNVLKAGDPVFFRCNSCKRFTHVVLCNGYNSDGYAVDYAHNNPHDGKHKLCTYPHCGTNNWTMYSIRMNDDGRLYGEKSDLEAPKINDSSNVKTGIKFSWNAIEEAESYRVYRKTSCKSWVCIDEIKETTYTDETVNNGGTYIYTVRAVNESERSQYYEGLSLKFLSQVSFASTESDNSAITIKWKANTKAEGYYLYRKVNDGAWKRYKDITSYKTTSYKDKKVSVGNLYQYRILAFSGGTLSSYDSNGIGARLVKAPKLNNLSNAVGGMKVSWVASKGADHYRIYRRSDDGKKWVYLDKTEELYFIDTTVKSGKKYKYTVKAVAETNNGAFDKSGKTRLYLATPDFTTTSTDKGITLKWAKVGGAKGYYVYQKIGNATNWTKIATLKNVGSYTVKNVKKNVSYTYTVRAFNGSIMSGFILPGVTCVHGVPPEETTTTPPTEPPVEDTTQEAEGNTTTTTTTAKPVPDIIPPQGPNIVQKNNLVPTTNIYEY